MQLDLYKAHLLLAASGFEVCDERELGVETEQTECR